VKELTLPREKAAAGLSDKVRERLWVLLFCLTATLIIVFGVQGFEHARVNHFRDQSIQLPIIYSYADATLFEGDFLLQARETYVTFFYPILGYLSRYIPLNVLMFSLYVLATAVTVGGVYTIAETLFPGRRVGAFAVILWMAHYPNLGGDFIHSPFVTHSTFAISLALWAIVLILRRQYMYAALLLGFIANINAMTSFFVTFMWGFQLLFSWREWTWRTFVLPFLMGLTALPILIWRFSLPLVEASLDEFVKIIELRLWYVVFPFDLKPILWIGFFAMLALWVVTWRFGKPKQHQQIVKMMAGLGLLCIIAVVFAEFIPVEFVIELQLIRSSWLINFFIMFYLANSVYFLLRSDKRLMLWLAIGLVVALAASRIVMAIFPFTQPTPYFQAMDFRPEWVGRYELEVLVGVGVLVAVFLWNIWNREAQRHRLWFGVAIVAFVIPMFIGTNVPEEQVNKTDDWESTLFWIKDHTPQDAMFFSPPTLDGFRVTAQRPYIGDWKDGTVGIFNNGWAIEWYQLMLDFGFNEEAFAFEPLNTQQVCSIVEKYDVDYAVVFNEWQIDGQAEYTNDTFAVVPAPDLACS
jgi:hypothetical protein